jgi:hypothetical protein
MNLAGSTFRLVLYGSCLLCVASADGFDHLDLG